MNRSGASIEKAVFWDFDGTLTYSCPLWTPAVFQAAGPFAEQYGITFANLRPHLAYGFPWHDWQSAIALRGDDWWDHLFRKFSLLYQSYGLPASQADQAARDVRRNILNPAGYRLYEDAVRTLESCQAKGYANYLLSNNYPELEATINALGLSASFTGYVVSGVIGYNKPRPELFNYALELAGHPVITYIVGDNPIADIIGGFQAGMKTVLVHNTSQSIADYSLENLYDLVDIL